LVVFQICTWGLAALDECAAIIMEPKHTNAS
jgi:hypothetical protein